MIGKFSKKFDLEDIVESPNIAPEFKEEDLNKIADHVIRMFEQDQDSRKKWEVITNKALDIIELTHETKTTPWVGASNVKHPLIATAVTQFASRQMPLIVRNGKVAEAQVIGRDLDGSKEQRASRISKHMSYQLLFEMSEWEDEMDKLLSMLASVGTVFKKTYYDPVKQRPSSDLCNFNEIFIHNDTKCLDEARRITHKMYMHKNDIVERIRMGIYSEVKDDDLDKNTFDKMQEDKIHEVLEQHCYLDLDEDGYEEPYIVLVDRDLRQVLRIVARYDAENVELNEDGEVLRIVPVQHFTDFHFIRSPRGGFYSLGFGQLLYSLNATANTILNQLIDAGTLANTQVGLIDKRLKIPGGDFSMTPGRFQKVNLSGIEDIRKHILPLDFKEPSNVLFQLFGTIVEAGKEVSSVSDALTGREQAQNVAATTMLALIEQGSKVFSSIQKRIFKGLKKEFQKLFRLNRLYLDKEHYFRVLDDEAIVYQDDYIEADLDIQPIADPSVSSDAHRLARTQAQMSLVGQPGINSYEIMRRYLEDLETPNVDKILTPPDPNAPPPIEVIEKQSEIQERGQKLDLESKKLELDAMRIQSDVLKKDAEIKELMARATKHIADAEAAEIGQQLQQYKLQLDQMGQEMSAKLDALVQAKNPETNFTEEDVNKVVGGPVENEQEIQQEGMSGAGPDVEEPPSDETPI